ncbi:hypothetical protein [Leptolyngbya sp. FACHB-261]|uniref:hypothetical protein n=1 Tax=Leptolyngbya sp. FACHB-261 TaxID=2692806 RepID=UPI001687B91B|nr:hypothetical protein [Leptolyngbya sp. FACHB-261]MBD2100524.1 hypothetical protein [Leptolyngbya sp. FACHB-261]
MQTYSHAILTWAATAALPPATRIAAVVGAVLPDVPMIVAFVILKSRPDWSWQLFEEYYERPVLAVPTNLLHSWFVVSLLALAIWLWPHPIGLGLVLGLGGHAIVDTLTHVSDARPLLWPIAPWIVRGPVSYWEPQYGARWFFLFEHGLDLLALAFTGLQVWQRFFRA